MWNYEKRLEFPVNIKGDGSFFYVVSHESLKRFQAPVCPQHHIIIQKRDVPEHGGRKLPSRISFHNDIVIHFFRIKPAKDSFENVLIVVAAVKTTPYFFHIRLI